jgi:hypothetical protein
MQIPGNNFRKGSYRKEIINRNIFLAFLFIGFSMLIAACGSTNKNNSKGQIIIQEQGSFAVGGTVIANPGTFDPFKPTPDGQTYHGDHAYVFYQIPNVAWHRAIF